MKETWTERIYTLETRITKQDAEYFAMFAPEFAALCRRIWQDLRHGRRTDSRYVTMLCRERGYMKRTVNSALRLMKGRMEALAELEKAQLKEREAKIAALGRKIAGIKDEINTLKGKVAAHPNDKTLLQRYRNKKKRLYSWQQRKLRLRNGMRDRDNDIRRNNVLCFGGRKMFRAQYSLADNGYKTHGKWLNDFRKLRDRQIYYIGSAEETAGNQMCQLSYIPETDRFMLKVRKERAFCSPGTGRNDPGNYLWLDIDFKYRKDMLIKALKDRLPLSYTVTRKGGKWYVDVSFRQICRIRTDAQNGCVAMDFNNGFIAITETDKYGNIVKAWNVPLIRHGTGDRAKSEISEKLSRIVRYARDKDKAVAIEDLRFGRTKSQQTRKGKRTYNRMLHLLDYRRYKQMCRDCCATHGVMLKLVNPAYTSMIGRQKYAGARKLSVHSAAAYVIARRAQGFKDEYIRNGKKPA